MDKPQTSEAVVMQRRIVDHRQAAATGSACQLCSSQTARNTAIPFPPPGQSPKWMDVMSAD